jgi:hypothetical protein
MKAESMEKQWGFNQQKWEDPYVRGLLKQNILAYYETYIKSLSHSINNWNMFIFRQLNIGKLVSDTMWLKQFHVYHPPVTLNLKVVCTNHSQS